MAIRRLKLKRKAGKKADLPKKKLKRRGKPTHEPTVKKKKGLPMPWEEVGAKLKAGDNVVRVLLDVYGGLSKFRISRGTVIRAGKKQLSIEYFIGDSKDLNVTENIERVALGTVMSDGVESWRNAYSNWRRFTYCANKKGIPFAKEKLVAEARGFFTEAELTCRSALSGISNAPTVNEVKYGF